MRTPLQIDVITIFPEMLDGFLGASMMKRAAQLGAVQFRAVNLRTFTTDVHRTTDDRPFGGGPGMVLKCEPVFAAVDAARTAGSRVILMTPQGRRFDQATARRLADEQHLIFVCGHYEGVDERIRQAVVDEEISIGDYVLTNGVLPAAVVIDAVVRLLPNVLGGENATAEESFAAGQLEYPQYTRPAEFRGLKVPDVLLSGNHAAIARWRADAAHRRTRARRPDLLKEEGQDNHEQGT
jgi:tRNA (guanine37-N1)-methyltransferase